ncbi:RNA-binding cell elongation regulator Jag/EloR [Bacillus solimangrovi]|uniref:RNA-binding protein KhpB n=1 Tax=Bacillus solimangrovi TaxID=1305675 RepID=A0A1E5LD31_9BACI|nr:RNA-binding cell elongation regulator Jag/EloR [Bacillus solimangrovi]OEH91985.1 protein jag [Bacillus solimangrovi]
MRQVTATGQSVEDALSSALEQLETTKEFVDIHVIDQGKKGFLGVFGARPAIVKVTVTLDPIDKAVTFLKEVTSKMGLDVNVEVTRNGNDIAFNLAGEKLGLLIGKRGQTLNSLQYLAHLVANRYSDKYLSVSVDAENYRERRKETIEVLATRLAEKAIHTKKDVTLEPMPSFERKIIHNALYNNKHVHTKSIGYEPKRHIIISPKINN